MTQSNAHPGEAALLPCPFCDAPARFVWTPEPATTGKVKCTRPSCGATSGAFDHSTNAIAAWNTRKPLPADALDGGSAAEMSREMRLKLDRRIRNQRLALRENWMIVEQRARGTRQFYRHIYASVVGLLDALDTPRETGDGGTWTIFKRIALAKEAALAAPQDAAQGEGGGDV